MAPRYINLWRSKLEVLDRAMRQRLENYMAWQRRAELLKRPGIRSKKTPVTP